MTENPSPLPPDDPCFQTVATYQDYAGTRIDAYLHAKYYQNFAENFGQWQQCCPELRTKFNGLRSENSDPEALRTFNIPREVFDRQSECGKHPYFQESADGGLSPSNIWFREERDSRNDFWVQQYADLGTELHDCCLRHLSQCLFQGTEARSCIGHLLPEEPPSSALPAASTPEPTAPAVPPPAAPVAGETQATTLVQWTSDYGPFPTVVSPAAI